MLHHLIDPQEVWSRLGVSPDAYFGTSVATAGDVNGDGYSDVIVGEPGRTLPWCGPTT